MNGWLARVLQPTLYARENGCVVSSASGLSCLAEPVYEATFHGNQLSSDCEETKSSGSIQLVHKLEPKPML